MSHAADRAQRTTLGELNVGDLLTFNFVGTRRRVVANYRRNGQALVVLEAPDDDTMEYGYIGGSERSRASVERRASQSSSYGATQDVIEEVAAERQARLESRGNAHEEPLSPHEWAKIHRARLENIEDQVAAGDTAATRDELIRAIACLVDHVEAISNGSDAA